MIVRQETREDSEKMVLVIDTDGYPESVAVSAKAFLLAEKMNHHPEVVTRYNQVLVTITTHDAGHRVTDLDRQYMAALKALL